MECAGSTSGGEKNVKRTIEEKEMATTKTEGTEKATWNATCKPRERTIARGK